MQPVGWGILGTGVIAHKFAAAFAVLEEARLVAVGSRSEASATAFAQKWQVEKAYGSYEQLLADRQVEVVYIATPHMLHEENTRLCLEAGKHVVCEKPFTVNAVQSKLLFALARKKNLFLMEALWSRFVPGLCHVLRMIENGVIGQVQQVNADFGFFSATGTEGRHFNPALAGGALLDVGIYPLAFAFWILGNQPDSIHATVRMSETGVDAHNTLQLCYPSGQIALLASSIDCKLTNSAVILGDKGKILLDRFWCVEHIVWEIYNGSVYSQYLPVMQNGYEYEISEASRCIRACMTQSPLHQWSDTFALMQTMDNIRQEWGLHYPCE